MATHKRIDALCLIAVLVTLLLTALFMNGEALGISALADGDAGDGQFTQNDRNADWDRAGATEIRLSGEGGEISGSGAVIEGGDVYILRAGKYRLSGELTDGSLIIDAGSGDKIWLLLDGVSLRCEQSAALRIEQAGKVFLTLAEGTENEVSSGAEYDEDSVRAGVDGTIYARDDLTINGAGALTVSAEYRHGIVCNDDLAICGGTLTIRAAEDGIHANDSARFTETALTINAGDDGVTVSNDDGTGYIYIASGTIDIPACYEGLEAVSITIDGGTIDIAPTDDGINANGQSGSTLTINGGDITITNPDGRDADGLDSNGDIFITGGRLFISVADKGGSSAIDYGSESGGVCRISGGTVIACGSGMMAEGFDESSEQAFIMHSVSAEAGSEIMLADEDGALLLRETIPCGFSSLILSTPELRLGGSYTLTVGGAAEQVLADNSGSSHGFGAVGAFGGMGGTGRGRGERPDAPPDGERFQAPDQAQPPEGEEAMGGPNRPPEDGGQGTPPERNDSPGGRRMEDDAGSNFGQRAERGMTVSFAAWARLGALVLLLGLGILIAVKVKH